MDKYDTTTTWTEPCAECGESLVMTAARWEVLGPYHDGCFGWPACSCATPHRGECPVPEKENEPATREGSGPNGERVVRAGG